MTISPISYSNYQNTINIRKNNNLQNNPQNPKNQVAFKGLKKVATKTTQEALTKNSGKILATLTALGVAIMASLGIKTSKEKELDTLLDNRRYQINGMEPIRELKNTNPDLYKKLLVAYKENPELIKELMFEKIYFERYCMDYDVCKASSSMYSLDDIIAINEVNKVNPSLTNLTKKALGGFYTEKSHHLYLIDEGLEKDMRKQVINAILVNSEKVDLALKSLEKTHQFNNYFIYKDKVYTVEDLLKEIKEYDTKTAIAFKEAKQKAQDKFGIEITEVIADSHPSKGDCDVISYTFEGKEQKCYLPAPPGGRTETEVLEALIKKYNSVEEFRSVPVIDNVTKTINF